MRLRQFLPVTLAALGGAVVCVAIAWAAVGTIETQTRQDIRTALIEGGHAWAVVDTDGLRVEITGTAPDEAARFAAIAGAAAHVDASRIIDATEIAPAEAPPPPPYSVEILRNDDGVSLIGLVPRGSAQQAIFERAGRTGRRVTDLLEPADYPVPATWSDALDFALDAMETLPRSKIAVSADVVRITAITDSAREKQETEARLRDAVPEGVRAVLDITAPRPVLTPFTLRFVIDDSGARFDACSAANPSDRDAIVAAAREAGLSGETACLIGLGQPAPSWPEATRQGIAAVAELGGGSVTFSDADVTLTARPGTRQGAFDRVAGRLETTLPDVFSLTAVLPEPPETGEDAEAEDTAPVFTASREESGRAVLIGRLPDTLTRDAVASFAQARFGKEATDLAIRIGGDLPPGWPIRVLVTLEALSLLNQGTLTVEPDRIDLEGLTGDRGVANEVARLIAARLGNEGALDLDITYVEALDPVAALPTPEECVARINAAIAARKITFAPGSTEIEAEALQTIDAIAEALRDCQTVAMEIGGHTDSQGRESMNLRLSQSRADAVLNAIMARRVLTSNLTAKGYGETRPIADNGTEDGREANRRIEFQLILPEGIESESETAAEAGSEDEAGDAPPDATRAEAAPNPDIPKVAPEARPDDLVPEGTVQGDSEDPAADDGTGDGDTDAGEAEETDEQN